jgi:hypothetical protein
VTESPSPNDLVAVLPELDRAALDLELLGLVRVHVAGDAAAGGDRRLDQHVLAARVARGLVERDAFAGDGILDCLSGGNHFGFLLVPWGSSLTRSISRLVALMTMEAPCVFQ